MPLPRGWKRENVLRLLEIAEKFDAATLELWCDQGSMLARHLGPKKPAKKARKRPARRPNGNGIRK